MSSAHCVVCDSRTDANLCGRCTRRLEKALAELPALLHELDITISRQDRGTGAALYAVRRRNVQIPGVDYTEGQTTLPSTPWPFSWDAADLRWRVESTVVTWARHLLEARGVDLPAGNLDVAALFVEHKQLTGGIAAPGHWLLSVLASIRLDQAAGQLFDELVSCHTDLIRAIDRQDPDIFAGACDAPDVRIDNVGGTLTARVSTCGADLYASLGDANVTCRVCGMTYELARRLRTLAASVDDHWARPQLIADALTTLDEPVNAATLRKWIERDAKLVGRLTRSGKPAPYPLVLQVGIDDDEKPLYRVGDVRARIAWSREQTRAVGA